MGPVRLLLLLAAVALATMPVVAYPEDAAADFDERVVAAGHLPATVHEGEQWQAFLQLAHGANVTTVGYQACLVPGPCIISPRAATSDDGTLWTADSAAFRSPLDGKPYAWPAGKVGITWYLATGEARAGVIDFANATAVPQGTPVDDPSCVSAAACLETHYLTFDVQDRAKASPPVAGVLAVVVLTAAAGWRRHG